MNSNGTPLVQEAKKAVVPSTPKLTDSETIALEFVCCWRVSKDRAPAFTPFSGGMGVAIESYKSTGDEAAPPLKNEIRSSTAITPEPARIRLRTPARLPAAGGPRVTPMAQSY